MCSRAVCIGPRVEAMRTIITSLIASKPDCLIRRRSEVEKGGLFIEPRVKAGVPGASDIPKDK